MDRYLEKFNFPRLNQEEIEIMKKSIRSTEIKMVIKKCPQKHQPRARLLHKDILSTFQFSTVQSLSHVRLFVTPWTAACQASLSITNSRSSLKLMSIESMMPSNHLILCHLAVSLSQLQGLFQ